jgi:UDP-glucuronate 4-epimerase
MASYLVTGAAGFIGAYTAQLLMKEGHQVVGVDNLNDAYHVAVKQHRLKHLVEMPQFQFHQADIADKAFLETMAAEGKRFDAVINLAARAGVRPSVENPWLYYEANLTGTLNMLELCRRSGIPKFILASTSSIYGANPPYPTPETASSSEPLQPYAASKKAAEVLAHTYHHLHGIDVSIVRYFTVYGPAGRPDLAMFRFCKWIEEGEPVLVNGDGKQSRGFTYVDDIAKGTILALKLVGFDVFNLGGHEVITINDLIHLMEECIGKKAVISYGPPNPADMFTNWADVSKAKSVLGWEPKVSLRQGIQTLIDWYRLNREWAKEVI